MSVSTDVRTRMRCTIVEYLAIFDEQRRDKTLGEQLERTLIFEPSNGELGLYRDISKRILASINPWKKWTDGKNVMDVVTSTWSELWSLYDIFGTDERLTRCDIICLSNIHKCFLRFVDTTDNLELGLFSYHESEKDEATILRAMIAIYNCHTSRDVCIVLHRLMKKPECSIRVMEFAVRMPFSFHVFLQADRVIFALNLVHKDPNNAVARFTLSRAYFSGCGVLKQSYEIAAQYGIDPKLCVPSGYRETDMVVCLSVMINDKRPMFTQQKFVLSLRLVCKTWYRKIMACNNFWSTFKLHTADVSHGPLSEQVIVAMGRRQVKNIDIDLCLEQDAIAKQEAKIEAHKLKISENKTRMRDARKEKLTTEQFLKKRRQI